jgi:hypothetical protein
MQQETKRPVQFEITQLSVREAAVSFIPATHP